MSKFCELTADKVIEAKTETLVLTYYVNDPGWLYFPKFVLVRRIPTDGRRKFAPTPVTFRVELTSPVVPGPFVVDEFTLTTDDMHRTEGLTIWGYQDRCDIYATSDNECRVQVLLSCLIEEGYNRANVTPGATNFALVITDSGEPHGFNFGTSEITTHTTHWDFGDGNTAACPAVETVQHTYAASGSYEVSATCHGLTETTTLDTTDPPIVTPTLTDASPSPLLVGAPVTVNLSGTDFTSPMQARFWSASTFMGIWDAAVQNPKKASVDIDTTGWPTGMGGVDVVTPGPNFSNQLQIPVE